MQAINTLSNSVTYLANHADEIVKIHKANQSFLTAATLAGRSVIPIEAAKGFVNPLTPLTDHFTFVKQLSEGSFGQVGLWVDLAGHPFAIKEMHLIDPKMIPGMVAAAINEFEIGLALDHPNIVKIHHYVTKVSDVGNRHYLIMEYIEGSTLGELLYSEKPLPGQPIELMRQAVNALSYMFNKDILPDDLHSANIMVKPDGTWKFIDVAYYRRLAAGEAHARGKNLLDDFVRSLLSFEFSSAPATS